MLEGYQTYAILPLEIEFSLSHHKDIKRQEKQIIIIIHYERKKIPTNIK